MAGVENSDSQPTTRLCVDSPNARVNWRREYLNQWTSQDRQCQMSTRIAPLIRCQNVAKFGVQTKMLEDPRAVCSDCLVVVCESNEEVHVVKL